MNGGYSRAADPDSLTILNIKLLASLDIRFLIHLYIFLYIHANVSSIWKTAIIAPLLKPHKSAEQGSNHRPMSLCCPVVNVLMCLLLPKLTSILIALTIIASALKDYSPSPSHD